MLTPPVGQAQAAVLVIQEMWGVTEHLLTFAESLAGHGYLAVVPHLYPEPDDPATDPARAKALVRGLNGAVIEPAVRAGIDLARQSGAARIGIVGFCMGGTVALWAAARAPVDAAVTFYGGGLGAPRWPGIPAGLELAAGLRAPWLGLYGEQDRSIPMSEVRRLGEVLADSTVPTDVVSYPGAGHAFAGTGAGRVEAAAADGWARAVTWFEAHL